MKTTGGKGLHFVLPIVRRDGWDEVKAFARRIAEHLAASVPTLFTATMSKAKRAGRVYVDYLRNGEGATAVAGVLASRASGIAGVDADRVGRRSTTTCAAIASTSATFRGSSPDGASIPGPATRARGSRSASAKRTLAPANRERRQSMKKIMTLGRGTRRDDAGRLRYVHVRRLLRLLRRGTDGWGDGGDGDATRARTAAGGRSRATKPACSRAAREIGRGSAARGGGGGGSRGGEAGDVQR